MVNMSMIQTFFSSGRFLKEVLFYPNIKNHQFDQLTFDLEKNNLRLYLESLKEDKQTFASYALQELYFENSPEQKIPGLGVVEDLDKITASSLASYYQEMMANDQIDILLSAMLIRTKQLKQLGNYHLSRGKQFIQICFIPNLK